LHRIPAENMVWADRNGNIGYQAVGIAPKRPNWSGLVPVPGDGRYEWDEFLPIKALPHVLNPEKEFYNTSNDYQIPRGWPYPEALHYTWGDAYRAQSVSEFLSSGRRFSVAEMVELQNSDLSIVARSLVPLLRDLEIANSTAGPRQAPLLFGSRRGTPACAIFRSYFPENAWQSRMVMRSLIMIGSFSMHWFGDPPRQAGIP